MKQHKIYIIKWRNYMKACHKKMDWSKRFIEWSVFCKKNLRFRIVMLLSNLCDYSNANIVAKGTIDLRAAANKNDKDGKDVVFKNSGPFT